MLRLSPCIVRSSFFFNAAPSAELYTLSLHDALPIYALRLWRSVPGVARGLAVAIPLIAPAMFYAPPIAWPHLSRSEEHTSELQSHSDLVCRLLLEKKNSRRISRTVQQRPSHTHTHAA